MSSESYLPSTDPNRANLIADRYRLKQSLGEGTFGEVFLAEDLKFNPPRTVAVKLLLRKYLNDPVVRASLEREASALARFNHPNIVTVLDFDISSKQAYIVMELAEGGSLADKIRPNLAELPAQMPLTDVAWYLEQICKGLDEAHEAGLIHRDLKPLNILLDKHDRPMIADFGLATAVNNIQSSMVADGTISGTPAYIAPEQWGGQVSRASDIYALGVITYQMITGQLPFQGDMITMAYQHTAAPIPRLKDRASDLDYPPALDRVLAGVLAKEAKQRTRPAMEFYRRFQVALDELPELTQKPLPHEKLSAWPVPENSNTPKPPISLRPNEHIDQPFELALANEQAQPQVKSEPHAAEAADYAVFNRPAHPIDPSVLARPTAPENMIQLQQKIAASRTSEDNQTVGCFLSGTVLTIIIVLLISLSLNSTKSTTPVIPDGVTLLKSLPGKAPVYSIAFSPDGKILASSSYSINVWNTNTYNLSKNFNNDGSQVLSIAFSPDGKTLASGTDGKTVKLWDVTSGNIVKTLSGHIDNVNSVAFSPDSKMLASGAADNTIMLWDVASGKVLKSFYGHSNSVNSVVFSPDGKMLASGGGDGIVKLWDVDSGKLIKNFLDPNKAISSVAFSPDGKTLAAGATYTTVNLWDITSGNLLTTWSDHEAGVSSVSFSPDGKTLASGATNNTIKLWDTTTYRLLGTISDGIHNNSVNTLSFSPDGNFLASGGGGDNTVKLWQLNWTLLNQAR